MPTDGADFGRIKACYGKVYTALRAGAEVSSATFGVMAVPQRLGQRYSWPF
jgi:hypothetical protein